MILNETELTAQERAILRAMDRMRGIHINEVFPELTPGEAHLLSVVISKPDGITVSALTEELGMPMSAVSRMMRNMEGRELIDRQIMPQDRRNIIVSITPRGRQICVDLHACFHELFQEMLETVDSESLGRFMEIWNGLMDCLETSLAKKLAANRASIDGKPAAARAAADGGTAPPGTKPAAAGETAEIEITEGSE